MNVFAPTIVSSRLKGSILKKLMSIALVRFGLKMKVGGSEPFSR